MTSPASAPSTGQPVRPADPAWTARSPSHHPQRQGDLGRPHHGLLLSTLLLASPAGFAASGATCEELRRNIAAQIESKGISDFSISIVDAAAVGSLPGRVVGSCEKGDRKLLYTRGGPARAATGAGAASGAGAGAGPSAGSGGPGTAGVSSAVISSGRARVPVITECADGRTVMNGSCKR